MKFFDDVYRILETDKTDCKIVSRIALNKHHMIYSVHFPGQPVTPGVIQLKIVKDILENQLDLKLKLKSLSICKFTQVLNPLICPELTINAEFKFSEGLLQVKATGTDAGKSFFAFNSNYQDNNDRCWYHHDLQMKSQITYLVQDEMERLQNTKMKHT